MTLADAQDERDTPKKGGYATLSAGDLRTLLDGLDDDAAVLVETPRGFSPVLLTVASAQVAPTDALDDEPWATDPEHEPTKRVLLISTGVPGA